MLTCSALVLEQDDFHLKADLTFAAGQVTAVMGPSGAGKSTLLSAIAGFFDAATGEVSWDRQPISALAPGKRPVSILFQDNNLFPHLTVEENVALGLGRTKDPARVKQVLAQVGLSEYLTRKPSQLSGGQQSRVGIARMIVAARPVVLLDEPFAALGPGLKAEMLELTRQMLTDTGCTILKVTHDPDDARQAADAVAWIDGGVVQAPRATAEIFADPPPSMTSYLGAMG